MRTRCPPDIHSNHRLDITATRLLEQLLQPREQLDDGHAHRLRDLLAAQQRTRRRIQIDESCLLVEDKQTVTHALDGDVQRQ